MEIIIGKDAKVIYVKDGATNQTNTISSQKATVTVPGTEQNQ